MKEKLKKLAPTLASLIGMILAAVGVQGLTAASYTDTPLASGFGVSHALMAVMGAGALVLRETKLKQPVAVTAAGVPVVSNTASEVHVAIGDRKLDMTFSPECKGPEVAGAVSFCVQTIVGSKEGTTNAPKPVEKPVAPNPAPAAAV